MLEIANMFVKTLNITGFQMFKILRRDMEDPKKN